MKIWIALFIAISFGAIFWPSSKSPITASRLSSKIPNQSRWEIKVSPGRVKRAEAILKQPFCYEGRGYLSYNFVSDDGKYLLKLLRHQRLRQAKSRQRHLFESYKMAFEHLAQESGIISLQLNKPDLQKPQMVTIKEHFELDLNKTEYLLQQRGEDVKAEIAKLMKEKRLEAAKKRINQLFILLQSMIRKGLVDTYHPSKNRLNMAFLKDRAIISDSGRLRLKLKLARSSLAIENIQSLKPINKWLMLHYPELSIHFQEQCSALLQESAK